MIKQWKAVQCALCQREKPMQKAGDPHDTRWELPEGWFEINCETHLCEDCYALIYKYKKEVSWG